MLFLKNQHRTALPSSFKNAGRTFSSWEKKNSAGFTLIELLVVIAIIGLLASVILASLSSARAAARDAERLSDMRQIRTALQMYYSDHGHFPNIGSTGQRIGEGEPIDNLLKPYFEQVPLDPLGPGDPVHYYSYDYSHNSPAGCNTGSRSGAAVIVAFNHSEASDPGDLNQDVDCGCDHNICNSDYNIVIGTH